MLSFEIDNYDSNTIICGIDEAGRGPLAGPVVACACIPDFNHIIEGVNDSKKLTEKKRNKIYNDLIKNVLYYKTVFVSHEIIDKVNILQATKFAMTEALKGIYPEPNIVLIDAVSIKSKYKTLSIVKGDMQSYAIACASIIAKVERDKLMCEYFKKYPQYDFINNKGYGTKKHIEALNSYGACPIHRNSFIKKFII